MARGRMINQSIATDKRLNSLSIEAQLVYLMTIPHLDRDGLILGEPSMLFSEVCRRRPELRDMMPSIIEQWIAQELVIQYDGKEDPILFFVGFSKNQGGMRYDRETPSQFPPPPGYKRTATGLHIDEECLPPLHIDEERLPLPPSGTDSGSTPAVLRQQSGSAPSEGNRKEEKVIRGGGTPPSSPTRTTPPAPTRTRADHTRQQAAQRMRREYPNVDAKLLTKLTNHVKRIYGYSVLIEKPGSDDLEDKLRDEAYRLWDLGFDTDEKMLELTAAWREKASKFSDKRPYGNQLYEEAVQLLSQEPVVAGSAELGFALEDLL